MAVQTMISPLSLQQQQVVTAACLTSVSVAVDMLEVPVKLVRSERLWLTTKCIMISLPRLVSIQTFYLVRGALHVKMAPTVPTMAVVAIPVRVPLATKERTVRVRLMNVSLTHV